MDGRRGVIVIFGEPWDAPMLDDRDGVLIMKTPAGRRCYGCEEAIEPGERGLYRTILTMRGSEVGVVHAECEMLTVMGHSVGVCSCSHGHLSRRQQALAMLAAINDRRRRDGMGDL